MQLGRNVKITKALDYASGAVDRDGAVLDMAGWEGVLVLVTVATVASGAVTGIKAQQGAVSTMADAADLKDSALAIADADDNKVFWFDLKPNERYVRVVVDKDGTNACAESAVYIQYGPSGIEVPITDANGESHALPAEGAA